MNRRVLWAAVVVLGCGGSPATRTAEPAGDSSAEARDQRFPSRSALQAVLGARLDGDLAPPEVRVATWDLAGPFPDAVGVTPVAAPTTWEQPMVARGAVVSEQMRCAAREIGRFYLANERNAPASLRRFVLSRCGATAIDVTVGAMLGEVDPAAPDDQVFESRRQAIEAMAAKTPRGIEAGLWLGREGGDAAVVQVMARPLVQITSAPRVADSAGWLRIEGEVLGAAESVDVLINQGAWAVERCALDPMVVAPRFAAYCAPRADDAIAWIEVAAFPPNRVLGSGVFRHLVWPAGRPPMSYQRRVHASATSGEDPRADIAALIAEARRTSGLGPLKLDRGQSQLARGLAPHYFRANAAGDGRTTDTVALGLMAGWDVSGRIQRGWFQSQLVGTTDLGELLGEMFERPFGRRVLLNPHATVLAIGETVDPDKGMLGALFATYATVENFDPVAARATARAVLDKQRKLAKLGPSAPMSHAQPAVDDACQRLGRGEVSARDAMDDALSDSMSVMTSAAGYLAGASVLAEVDLPPKLVTSPHPVALCVALYQVPGSPWWSHAVIAVSGQPAEGYEQIKLPGGGS